MTPSFIGRTAMMPSGVRPSMRFAFEADSLDFFRFAIDYGRRKARSARCLRPLRKSGICGAEVDTDRSREIVDPLRTKRPAHPVLGSSSSRNTTRRRACMAANSG
jgi:hypothetical protein